jgi:hypothetical protein
MSLLILLSTLTYAGIVVILLPFHLVLLVQRKLRSDRRKDAHRLVLDT